MGAVLSRGAVRALGVFGLTTRDVGRCDGARRERARAGAEVLDWALGPEAGRIALVLGPSGSGKSTLLRSVREMLLARGERVIDAGELLARAMGGGGERSVIDALAQDELAAEHALPALSAAGLADAFVPTRRVRELSDGERARFGIALAIQGAGGSPCEVVGHEREAATILLDELGGALDDATAGGVCATLSRWVRGCTSARLICVGTREGVLEWLGPDVVARVRDDGQVRVHRALGTTSGATSGLHIEHGSLADYRALAHLHYRAAAPATIVRTLGARVDGRLVGVLAVSMPTLNGAWRRHAWPGEYAGPALAKREAAARLNRDVRCISRVIVDPRWRGRGAGSALVRAYLADPLTPRTEAVSAMGALSPIFSRAGMREWILERSARDARLADAIEAAGLRPWMIADIDLALQAAARRVFLERALRTWARAHGPTRSLASGPLDDIIQAAAKSIVRKPRAYTSG